MKRTNVPLLKFKCDHRECGHECYVNQNNSVLTHYNPNMSALLDWTCPECKEGKLRYSSTNAKYSFSLIKDEKDPEVAEAKERSSQA